MRVLMISYTSLLQRAYRAKCDLMGRLPGVDLTVLTSNGWKEKWSSGRPVRYEAGDGREPYRSILAPIVFAGNGHLAFFRRGLGPVLRDLRPDLIDLEREPWCLAAAQVLWFRRRYCPRARLLFHASQNILKTYPPPFGGIEKAVFRRADGALARSETAARVLRARGFRGRVDVIPHGVDTDRFAPPASVPEGVPVVGFVGALTPQKGVDGLLEAVARLAHTPHVLIVGDGPERARLGALCRRLGIEGHVEFAGAIPHARIPEMMKRMTLLALPAVSLPGLEERFGRVLLEAMATGLPIVATDSGEIPRVVGDAGTVVPEGRPEDLARALEEMLARREATAAVGRRARARVEETYSWRVVVQRTFDVYRDVLAASR